jgi:hypothetical protein
MAEPMYGRIADDLRRKITINVPESAHLRLSALETSRLLAGTIFDRWTDVSTKCNLALLLSHMLRWKRLVFLDDDILVPDPADLSKAVGLLDTLTAVGPRIGGFPDRPVVCQAFRDAGGGQGTSIGAEVLAVDVKRNCAFFPNISNEDRFFVLDVGTRPQPLATEEEVFQEPYDPYRSERARAEEFGDVLAEGTFWLLDQDRSASDGDVEHRREFTTKRERFIGSVLGMSEGATILDPAETVRRAEALNAALGRLARWPSPLSRLLWETVNYERPWPANHERPWLSPLSRLLWMAYIRSLLAEQQKAADANFQAKVSNALLRFNVLRHMISRHCEEAEQGQRLAFLRALIRIRSQQKWDADIRFRYDLQSLDPAELETMLRHMGLRVISSPRCEEAEQDQRLAFLRALIRIRSQLKRGADIRSSLFSLQSDPLSRQTSTRDRMTASSHSLRGPTFPAASWPTRGTAIAA